MEEEQRETQNQADMQGEEREDEDVVEIQNEEGNIYQSRDQSHDVPVLPNLALEAIERLRERPLDEDSVSDDFQPTRKKRKHNQKKDTSTSDENEVRHICGHAPLLL